MKKTIIVFLMACSTVQARRAHGLIITPIKPAAVIDSAKQSNSNTTQGIATTAEKTTATEYNLPDIHRNAVTNDAFDKIGLVDLP